MTPLYCHVPCTNEVLWSRVNEDSGHTICVQVAGTGLKSLAWLLAVVLEWRNPHLVCSSMIVPFVRDLDSCEPQQPLGVGMLGGIQLTNQPAAAGAQVCLWLTKLSFSRASDWGCCQGFSICRQKVQHVWKWFESFSCYCRSVEKSASVQSLSLSSPHYSGST